MSHNPSPSARLATALFDGDRLRQARMFRGWRKTDVAGALGLTPAAVGQYEAGRTRPSPAVLAAMSLRMGFEPTFFERGRRMSRVPDSHVHFRSLRATSKMDRDRMLARVELMAELVDLVERHVQLPDVGVPSVPAPSEVGGTDPEYCAADLRRNWRLGGGPIDNMARLLENKGVIVVRPRVGSGAIDAFSTDATHRPIVVLASDKDDCARSRFDAAHELGHLLMHHDAEPGRQSVEREAQQFAAAFLMPADVIAREFPRRMSWGVYFELKERWRVSIQALLYRARTLGALSPDAYQRAQRYLSRSWGRTSEPVELGPPEQPNMLQRALDLMASQLNIGRRDLAASLGLPREILDDLVADLTPTPERPIVSWQEDTVGAGE